MERVKHGLIAVQIIFCLFAGLRFMANYFFSTSRPLEAMAVDPYNYIYHFGMGVVLMHKENLEAAARRFERVLELNPGYHNASNNLAIIYIRQAKFDEALQVLEALRKVRPHHEAGRKNYLQLKKLIEKKD